MPFLSYFLIDSTIIYYVISLILGIPSTFVLPGEADMDKYHPPKLYFFYSLTVDLDMIAIVTFLKEQ